MDWAIEATLWLSLQLPWLSWLLWLLPQLLLLVVSLKELKRNKQKQVEVYGMGKFPSQAHRTSSIGDIEDFNNNRRIEEDEILDAQFVPVFNDTSFLHLFDNDTIKSPYQSGRYEYAIIGGSGTGNSIVNPIFIVVDAEKPTDFYKYYKP
jgi:hypothetical protein